MFIDYHSDGIVSPIEHSGHGFKVKDTRFNIEYGVVLHKLMLVSLASYIAGVELR